MASPSGFSSDAPSHVTKRPIPLNIHKVKTDFKKVSELFAIHAQEMPYADVVTFSQHAAKYKKKQSQYEDLQILLMASSEQYSTAFDRFAGIPGINREQLYSERYAKRTSLGLDMQYCVLQMNVLMEDFLPSDDE